MSLVIKQARLVAQGSGRVMPGVGDPGIFGDIGRFIGGTIKTAAQLVPGPVGSLARRIFNPAQQQQATQPILVSNGVITTTAARFQQGPDELLGPPRPGFIAAGQRAFAGGETGRFEAQGGMTLACATGFHPNKSDYFTKRDGLIPKGTRCVRNRRRNPLNARAMDRAISRLESGKRATKRMSRVTIRKKC